MPSDKFQLSREVLIKAIRPALILLEAGGLAAEQLVLGTGIQESLLSQPGSRLEAGQPEDCFKWKRLLMTIAGKIT